MRNIKQSVSLSGDTIIEVMISITIFCLVSILTINLMNSGVATAQASLQVTMARNEIDAQSEAIRYIQNSYLAEKNFTSGNQEYYQLWRRMTGASSTGGYSISATDFGKEPFNIGSAQVNGTDIKSCEDAYNNYPSLNKATGMAFVINTRRIQPFNGDVIGYNILLNDIVVSVKTTKLVESTTHPRLIFGSNNINNSDEGDLTEGGAGRYSELLQAEGIWVVAVFSGTQYRGLPEFIDFHIRTCWYAPGRQTPSTIGTMIRLYNPETVEIQNV